MNTNNIKEKYYQYLCAYLNQIINFNKYDTILRNSYHKILINNEDNIISNYLKLYNTIYIERLRKEEVNNLKELISKSNNNQEFNLFIEKTYQKVIKFQDNDNKYYINLNNQNINPNNIVENNSLVLVINYIEDFNMNIKEKIKLKNSFIDTLKLFENEIKNTLKIPIKILANQTIIPPKQILGSLSNSVGEENH